MKDITIRIRGKQIYDNQEEDQMEFVTEGQLYERNGSIYMIYEETEVSGMQGCKTTLKLNGETLKMKRMGMPGFNSEMYFEKGKRFAHTYETPYGPMDMEMLTREVNINFDRETMTGNIDVSYNVSLHGVAEGKNKLEIEIM